MRTRAERRELLADMREVDRIIDRWDRVCQGAGLLHTIDTVSGPTILTPKIVDITLGPPLRLIIHLLAGMLRTDVVKVARRLAEGMGYAALRVVQTHHNHVTVTLLDRDPLAELVAPFPPTRSVVESPPILGLSETADPVPLDLAHGAHLVWQGGSGSGKSTAAYGLLAQLVGAGDVQVTGSDPTALVLGPWAAPNAPRGREALPSPALGTADPEAHVTVLEELVAVMDDRIGNLPAGRDSVDLADPTTPLILVVCEEYPATLRIVEAVDKKATRFRAAVARLSSEGRKAGLRLLIMCQRADAAIIDGHVRAQASHRASWRVDSAEALRMLHADAEDALTDHVAAQPGIGLLTAPGLPLTRFRSPYLDYASYVAAVTDGEDGR